MGNASDVKPGYYRQCVLCGGQAHCHRAQLWHLPQLGEREIGFSSCKECGMVIQSPSVYPDEMLHYYQTTAVYTKNSVDYQPTREKVVSVRRNISDIKNLNEGMPATVFQVGCSDGYTLSQYKLNGADRVTGVDPSAMNGRIAKETFNIDTVQADIESFETEETYDLMVLTHILEHIYDPLAVVKKCSSFQETGGWMLAEVPLFEAVELFPSGYLSFEHINYFTEPLFRELIESCGYEIHLVSKVFRDYRYPAVTVIARKAEAVSRNVVDFTAETTLKEILQREKEMWGSAEKSINNKIVNNQDIYIWGAGVHTAQLLANTNILKVYRIRALVDNSETKWGLELHGIPCIPPAEVDLNSTNTILISSCASENEIYRDLKKLYGESVNLVMIYSND